MGTFNNSASLITSLYFAVYLIPPPAMMTNCFAWLIIFAAFFIFSFLPLRVLSLENEGLFVLYDNHL
jgi:hypothetical protein